MQGQNDCSTENNETANNSNPVHYSFPSRRRVQPA